MLDEARAKKNGALTTGAKGWAVAEAQAARTIERAKAVKIVDLPVGRRQGVMAALDAVSAIT